MPRNKHPEQTVEQILAISERLFFERGYEKTTMQDIIDELKMSKGAIYHHFKSKEDILQTIMDIRVAGEKALMSEIVENALNSATPRKLNSLMLEYFEGMVDIYTEEMAVQLGAHMKNPRFLVQSLKGSISNFAPILVKILPKDTFIGEDGQDYSLEYAELIALLFNIYSKSVVFGWNKEQVQKRWMMLQQLTKSLGVDIISDAALDKIGEIMEIISQ